MSDSDNHGRLMLKELYNLNLFCIGVMYEYKKDSFVYKYYYWCVDGKLLKDFCIMREEEDGCN